MALAHNGNLTNSHELRLELESQGSIFHTTTDSEVIAYIIVQERLRNPSIEAAVSAAMDKLVGAQMVVFNRMTPGQDVMPLHKIARAANRRIDILYDYTDGTTQMDDIADPLPFDINAPVIHILDQDFGLWYRDVTEEPEKYDGKTVCFKAQVAMLRRNKDGIFAPGRFVMTCCVEDIQFCGIPCRYAEAASLESRSWVMVSARISAEKHPLYKGEVGPVLTAIRVDRNAEPADPDVATF